MRFLLACIFLHSLACSDIEKAKQGRLVDTDPQNGAAAIFLDATFTLVFTEPFVLESLSSQAEDGPCTSGHTVILTANNFQTCLGGTITETSDGSKRRAILTPLNNLPADSELKLRLTQDIRFAELQNLTETTLTYRTGNALSSQDEG